MSEQEQPKFTFDTKNARIGYWVDGQLISKPLQEVSRIEFKSEDTPSIQEPISIGNLGGSFTFSGTITADQVESFFGAFVEPRVICKIHTAKGDFYAPVKSHDSGKIVLDVPDDEAEAWSQSEYWKAKLATKRGDE